MLGISDWSREGPVGGGGQVVLYVGVQGAERVSWLSAGHTMYSLAADGGRTGRAMANFPIGRFATLVASEYWGYVGGPQGVGHGFVSCRHALQQVCHFEIVSWLVCLGLVIVIFCC